MEAPFIILSLCPLAQTAHGTNTEAHLPDLPIQKTLPLSKIALSSNALDAQLFLLLEDHTMPIRQFGILFLILAGCQMTLIKGVSKEI